MKSRVRAHLGVLLQTVQALLLAVTVAACSSGGDGAAASPPPASPPPASPPPPANGVVSGLLQYEMPPPAQNCNGLNFDAIELRPIRQATVQLIDASSKAVLDSTVSDESGQYELLAPPQTNVFVRVRAELKSTSPAWDVQVRDNFVLPNDQNPKPLAKRPIYTMQGKAFNSGTQGHVRNLTATTGWGGGSYTGVRVAAPFAVLDAIYSGMSLVLGVEPAADFPPLDAFWSPENTTSGGGEPDIDSGELGTSFYAGESDSLFLLGHDGVDTEEFDSHVIVHEWGHYFEDVFSRSDSIGGAHGLGDLLDMRLAFSEGFATAISGMALNDPSYCDTLWSNGNLTGFEIDIESEAGGIPGWYNETSVMKILYDLWDVVDDLADDSSIGFRPIFDVMTGEQATTPAFTSIFSFASYLKQSGTGQNAFIDALLNAENINPIGIDIFGSTETNDGGPGNPPDVLPIYSQLTLGNTVNICTNSQFDAERDGNKLSEHRYLTLNIPSAQQVTFSMTANPAPSLPSGGFSCSADEDDPENHQHSDPDLVVWQNGNFVLWSISCTPNSENSSIDQAPVFLSAGDYVIDVNEFRFDDPETPNDFPEQVCFDIRAN